MVSATILTNLERDTGVPVHHLFDEIWGASIGSMMGALLTQPNPLTATECRHWLEHTFRRLHSAYSIRRRFKHLIPTHVTLDQTLLPLKILGAEVKTWQRPLWPQSYALAEWSSTHTPKLSLQRAASAACTIFPLHPYPLRLTQPGRPTSFGLDAGAIICGSIATMNPIPFFLTRHRSPSDQTAPPPLNLFFMSNGWARLPPDFNLTDKSHLNMAEIWNVDLDLGGLLRKWHAQSRIGRLAHRAIAPYLGGLDQTLNNLAGMGIVGAKILQEFTELALSQSEIYPQMLQRLQAGR